MKLKYVLISVALTLMLSSFFVFAGEGDDRVEEEDYVLPNMFFVPFLIYSNAQYGLELPDELSVDFKAWEDGAVVVEYTHPLEIEYFNFTDIEQYDRVEMLFEDEDYELHITFRKK